MALLSPTQVSQKAMISFFFHDTTEDGLPPIWKCKKCLQYKKKSGGWTNLLNHLKACVGPKYQEEYVQVVKDNVFAAFKPTVSKREADMFGWIEWVVMRNMPLAEVDDEITQTGMRYGPITSKLLRKMLFLLQAEVNCQIKEKLPDQIVIVFDGWTEGSDHYIAVHASYIDPISNVAVETLLSIRPLLCDGVLGMTAADHVHHISKTLSLYGKTNENIVCLAGDNCSVNQRMAKLLGVPLLGCGSHKFNLAVKSWMADKPTLIKIVARLSILMKKASTLKNTAALRQYTCLEAVTENATRWSSQYMMIARFFQIKSHLEQVESLAPSMLSFVEVRELQASFTHMKKFNEVTLALQKQGITCLNVRDIFDHVLEDYPEFQKHLGVDANIVQDKVFEIATTKIMKGEPLNDIESRAVIRLRKKTNAGLPHSLLEDDNDSPTSAESGEEMVSQINYADTIQQRIKRRKSALGSVYDDYICLDLLVGTSVSCERLFSIAKHILTCVRKSTSPLVFEAILFLKMNRHFWNDVIVGKAMGRTLAPADEF